MRSHTGLGPPFTKRSGPHRADAVQAALAQLTGIEQADQILMHGGNRVDGAKTLAQYNLPEVRAFAVWLEQGECGERVQCLSAILVLEVAPPQFLLRTRQALSQSSCTVAG